MIHCLIADTMHESLFGMLDGIGITYTYRPDIHRSELAEAVLETDILMIRSKARVDEQLLGDNPRLKVVARAGAGIDNLDVDYLERKGIRIINAPEGNETAVGEHCMGMLLALMNNLLRADRQVRQGVWDREGNRGHEIAGKTVGIVGYGHMGMSFARRLEGFQCKVLAYDKYKQNYGDKFCVMSGMDRIYDEADILSLHIPLTHETRLMVDDNYFNRFRKPLYFINAARGEIVRLSSVLTALESGKLRGAALDVLENEKMHALTPDQKNLMAELSKRDDVIFSPHVGGWTFESYVRINEVLTSKLADLLPLLS